MRSQHRTSRTTVTGSQSWEALGEELNTAANQLVLIWLQELLQQGGGDPLKLRLQRGCIAVVRQCHMVTLLLFLLLLLQRRSAAAKLAAGLGGQNQGSLRSPDSRCSTVLSVHFDLGFGATGPQRGHNAVLQAEGDHVTVPGHRKHLGTGSKGRK